MLTLLSLKDFVIDTSLSIEADKGLTCLTGETGAGKSILIMHCSSYSAGEATRG